MSRTYSQVSAFRWHLRQHVIELKCLKLLKYAKFGVCIPNRKSRLFLVSLVLLISTCLLFLPEPVAVSREMLNGDGFWVGALRSQLLFHGEKGGRLGLG